LLIRICWNYYDCSHSNW